MTILSDVSPYMRMALWYDDHPQDREFRWLVAWHLENGFVFSTPDFFIMGRTANKAFLERNGVILEAVHESVADCWYIHAMSGSMERAWSILPRELPWLAFERTRDGKLELQIVRTETLRRLSAHA